MIPALQKTGLSRRSFLRAGLTAAAGLALPFPAWARTAADLQGEKALSFYNLHTGEDLRRAVFWADGEYVPETLAELNHLLRDHRSGEIRAIDPDLFSLLHALRRRLDTRDTIHVISGYRSPATNGSLSRQSSGVAKKSLHMSGKAIDLRIPGRELKNVRQAALALQRGGVGYYPQSDFVHVDTGRVRFW